MHDLFGDVLLVSFTVNPSLLVPKSEVGKDAMTKLDGQMIQVSNFDGVPIRICI